MISKLVLALLAFSVCVGSVAAQYQALVPIPDGLDVAAVQGGAHTLLPGPFGDVAVVTSATSQPVLVVFASNGSNVSQAWAQPVYVWGQAQDEALQGVVVGLASEVAGLVGRFSNVTAALAEHEARLVALNNTIHKVHAQIDSQFINLKIRANDMEAEFAAARNDTAALAVDVASWGSKAKESGDRARNSVDEWREAEDAKVSVRQESSFAEQFGVVGLAAVASCLITLVGLAIYRRRVRHGHEGSEAVGGDVGGSWESEVSWEDREAMLIDRRVEAMESAHAAAYPVARSPSFAGGVEPSVPVFGGPSEPLERVPVVAETSPGVPDESGGEDGEKVAFVASAAFEAALADTLPPVTLGAPTVWGRAA